MNIDRNIASRALARCGQERLSTAEWNQGSSSARVRSVTDFYLSTIKEALDDVDWTFAKKRAALARDNESENLTDYGCCYTLPEDCQRPVALRDGSAWIQEGGRLYTDGEDAILIYITNGKLTAAELLAKTSAAGYTAEDIPEYDMPSFEDAFAQYIEVCLAAKIAYKDTGKNSVFLRLYQESEDRRSRAVAATRNQGVSAVTGEEYWTESVMTGGC